MLPAQDVDCSDIAARPAKRRCRTGPSQSEMQRSLSRLEHQEAEIDNWCTERTILDKILSPSYTTDLPSKAVRNGFVGRQASIGKKNTGKLRQSKSTLSSQDPENDEQSEPDPFDKGEDFEVETLSPSSRHSDENETLQPDWFRDAKHDSSSNSSDDKIDTTDGDDSRVDNCGTGCNDDTSDPMDVLQDQQHTPQSTERHEPGAINVIAPIMSDVISHKPHASSDVQTAVSSEVFDADVDPFGSGLLPSDPSPTRIDHEEPLEEVPSEKALLEGTLLYVSPQVTEAVQQEAAAFAEESPRVPTAIHYQAAAQLSPNERIVLINEFLQQNSARINDFRARRRVYPTSLGPGSGGVETTFSPAWDDHMELIFLTDAVIWLDTLLAPFRTAILAEDSSSLKPRIEQAVRDFEATEIPSRARTEEPLGIADRSIAQQFSECVAKIQTSNSTRTQLLEHINIDVSIFENLLLSAENIKYRRDLGRAYGQADDLVDGIRRIYSTIVCTIPVGLSGQDWIEQSAQPNMVTYGTGPFYSYNLPGRPEIFDHGSISDTRISSKGCTGVQMSGHQNPLSKKYWRNLHHEMSGTIAAQKVDDIGAAKLRKNPDCMNRDWDLFYNRIYGTGMANYAVAAAQRIESEANEEMVKQARAEREMKQAKEAPARDAQCTVAENSDKSRRSSAQEGPQDSSRRSSADCTDSSEATTKLDVGNQDNKKRTRLCPNVNKPGGCPDRSSCGAESHDNEGKYCKWGNQCKFGAERCAYIHATPSNTGSIPHAMILPRGSVASVIPRIRDLRSVLDQVLANPKSFKVCDYVNKPQGCKSGTGCVFNHTLEGVVCDDYQRDRCPRGFQCPLKHIPAFNFAAGPSTYMQYNPEYFHGSSHKERRKPYFLSLTPQNLNSYHRKPNTRGPGTNREHRLNDVQLDQPSDPDAQWCDPMDYEQSLQDRGLPQNTPSAPRSQYAQPPNVQPPFSKYNKDYGGSYNNDPQQNNRKRKDPSAQRRGKGRPLAERITRDEPFEEHYDGEFEEDYSDYPGDDDDDMSESQRNHCPRKKQKKSKKWPRGKKDGNRWHGR